MRHFTLLLAALCLAPALSLAQTAASAGEGRLKKIQSSGAIALAYRADAVPFSFEDKDKQPAGYTVDLCRGIVAALQQQLGLPKLEAKWVPVTAQTRFTAIASGQADLECGASTVTLGRMKEVSFSSLTFIDGTGLLVRSSTGGNSLSALAGKKIGVMPGTTNERALASAMKGMGVAASVVLVASREDGLAQLESGVIDALANDRVLLLGLAGKSKNPMALALLADALSYEPYAIALPRGDWELQHAVNTALSQIYRSGALPELYARWFSGLGKPTPVLDVMYGLGSLPE